MAITKNKRWIDEKALAVERFAPIKINFIPTNNSMYKIFKKKPSIGIINCNIDCPICNAHKPKKVKSKFEILDLT